MSSGYGLAGGPGRCFPFWQEMLACYVVNTNDDDDSGKAKCLPALEDYHECLHHTKELRRTMALQTAYRKKEAEYAREDAPRAGEIRRLGLLEGPPEEKHMHPFKFFPRPKRDNMGNRVPPLSEKPKSEENQKKVD